MSDPILPLQAWPEGILQARIPANDNALSVEATLRPCLGVANDEAGGDTDGDVWIVGGAPTGAFATFDEHDVALYMDGNWKAWAPFEGMRLVVNDVRKVFNGTAWIDDPSITGGGGASTIGRHAVPVMAGHIQPSATGGASAVSATATGANLPDRVGLSFSQATQQYAQFSLAMPKSWNEGTVTAVFLWSHPATTVNFGVVWGLQAVAVGDDDTIAATYGTAQEVTDTGGTTNDLYRSPETSAITIAGSPQAEDVVFFRAYRKPADAADTMAVGAVLLGIVVYITTDADTDA